jgi:branched-chain amino acid transport system ATP-binding protein
MPEVKPPEATPLLELRGVRASYGSIEALHGIDLVIDGGSILAVLGPNGAGKTTMLKVISGVMAPTGGTVRM